MEDVWSLIQRVRNIEELPPAEEVAGWLLFNGESVPTQEFTVLPPLPPWLFLLYLFLYCNKVVCTCTPSMSDAAHVKQFVRSIVECCLTAFGGSFINPALMALKAPPLDNEKFVLVMIFTWWLHHNSFFGRIFQSFIANPLVSLLVSSGYEIFRCWVMFAWYGKAVAALSDETSRYFGPVICGTLGGSGGMFLPWSKGLRPLEENIPWNMESAFGGVLLYHLASRLVQDPPLLHVRISIVLFLLFARVFPSVVAFVLPFVHKVLRALLGLTPHEELVKSSPIQEKAASRPMKKKKKQA